MKNKFRYIHLKIIFRKKYIFIKKTAIFNNDNTNQHLLMSTYK